MTRLTAVGPDGGGLLGFLASLGTLAVLDRVLLRGSVRLSWKFERVGWRPVYDLPGEWSEDRLVESLFETLSDSEARPEFSCLGDDLSVSPEVFRTIAADAVACATPVERTYADFVAAYGCEMPNDGKVIEDTALRTMSGAGHQHFLGSMRKLAQSTSAEHLRRALFTSWCYQDEPPTMRWDPIDDRRYAHRADDPSKSTTAPIRTVRGANRLAIEALPFFPTAPTGRRVETTGFRSGGVRGSAARELRWPIWDVPLSTDVVASLLRSPLLVVPSPDMQTLGAMGVVEVYSSTRITVAKFRNFTPAVAVSVG